MKAILFHQHGGPEVLEYTDVPTPEPGPGEALVKLEAAALNRMDLWVRNGWPGLSLKYPHIPGADGAGTITALGEGVTQWHLGDRVVINANLGCGKCEFCLAGQDNRCQSWHLLGETVSGTYAEYVVVPARQLYPLPEKADAHQAAAAGLVFHTAWHSLIRRAQLQAGESVLVIGASGGVNTASIQIAKYAGATVFVVGAQLTNKRGVDVIVDNVGTTFPMSFRAARKGGRILTVGNTGGPQFEIDNRFIFAKHLSVIGSTMGTLQDFATVMELVLAGKLRVAVDRAYPLQEAMAAQKRLESGQQLGKITLQINNI